MGNEPKHLRAEHVRIAGEEFVLFELELGSDDRWAQLTPAERAVLALLAGGASNRAIAAARGCAVRTVANQVASLLRKLDAKSRFELIERVARSGLPKE